MTTTTLRSLTVVFSMGLGLFPQSDRPAIAESPSAYMAPAKWNNFYPASLYAPSDGQGGGEALPIPAPDPAANLGSPVAAAVSPHDPQPLDAMKMGESAGLHRSADWSAGERLPLRPWFASLNLLLLNVANDSDVLIATGLGDYTTDVVNPGMTPGFEAEIGRYLAGGRYGIGVNYLLWNPESSEVVRRGSAGSIVPGISAYQDALIDVQGQGEDTVYNYITGAGPGAGAAGVRVYRDMFLQGIEANLYCFGLMGSNRVSYAGSQSGGCLGLADRLCGGCYGYGGAAGPLTRPDSGRVRVMASHGFRWLQIKDRLNFTYDIDGDPGFQAGDIYDCYRTENNLFGYQFGSQLTYCINSCWNLNIGGKFGIYGNRARLCHQLGSTTLAYTAVTDELIRSSDTETSLATIGELDFGLGRRIGRAWTIRGGYRLYGITGIALATDSIPTSYATLAAGSTVDPDDSLVLHGGYIGIDYNW